MMNTPPPLPPNRPESRSGESRPIPAVPIEQWRPRRSPYAVAAALSWILPVVCVAAWILLPRPPGSPLDRTITGGVRMAFLVGCIVSVIALLGIARRGGGGKGPAIVGLVLNGLLLFAFPR